MDVGVDQARKQRAITEIDHFCARRTLDGRPHLDDAFALHQDLSWLNDATRLNVQKACRMEHDPVGRLGLRLRLRLTRRIHDDNQQGQKQKCSGEN